MRSAALHRKVELTEDVLTASFFDLVRVHDDIATLRQLLDLAGIQVIAPDAWTRFKIVLWPSWDSGEPDAVILLFEESRLVAQVVVEVKAGAAKSGVDAPDDVAAGRVDGNHGDQLAKYLREAVKREPVVPAALIYLTHHPTAPRDEINASTASLRRPPACEAPIAWASWRDVEDHLLARRGHAEGPLERDIDDAVVMLRRTGLFRFRGEWLPTPTVRPAGTPIFWRRAPAVARTLCRTYSFGLPGGVRAVPDVTFYRREPPC